MIHFIENKTVAQESVTGVLAGVSDVLVTHPLWTVKTLQQQGMSNHKIMELFFRRPILAYTGFASNAGSMVPITTTRVVLSSYIQSRCESSSRTMRLFTSFLAGGVSSFIGAPIELIRTTQLKQATFTNKASSFIGTVKKIIQVKGGHHLFNGLSAIMLRDGLYTSAFFAGAPILTKELEPYIPISFINKTLAYSVAGITASFINHPFDTIKTQQHTALAMRVLKQQRHPSSFFEVMKDIVHKRGYKGFWVGYPPRGLRFLLGLGVKALCIEKMNAYWYRYT